MLTVLTLLAPSAMAEPPVINGVVRCGEKPVAGAVVRVESVSAEASARTMDVVGRPADLGALVRCDNGGRFRLQVHDEGLLYGLSAAAAGYQSRALQRKARAGETDVAIEIPRTPDAAPEGVKILTFHVTDMQGAPVSDALLLPTAVRYGPASVSGGEQFAGLIAVSDGAGVATIHLDPRPLTAGMNRELTGIDFSAEAAGFAPGPVRLETLESGVTEVRLAEGVRVSGRVVRDGVPAPGASVELLLLPGTGGIPRSIDRARTTSDSAGRFTFEHAPARSTLTLFTQPNPRDPAIAVPQRVATEGDGTAVEATDLELLPGHRVAGRIRRDDGQPIPEGERIVLTHDDAWLAWPARLGTDGSFAISGIPHGGPYRLTVVAEGQMMSERNGAYDAGYYTALHGHVTRDHDDLDVLLTRRPEPGAASAPRLAPLRGVE